MKRFSRFYSIAQRTTGAFAVSLLLMATLSDPASADTELQGPEVYVPPTSYPVVSSTPACQGNVTDANAPVRAMMGQFGQALSDSPDPMTAATGYITGVAALIMPQNKVQDYANCAMPCIVLSSSDVVHNVNIVYNYESPPRSPNRTRDFAFAAPAFGQWDTGPGWMRADKADAVTIGHGKVLQCVLVRNWFNGDAREMHARVDVHIN